MKEIWEEIENYEGLYWASNFGRVKSKRKILKPINGEYLKVGLSKKGVQKTLYIHRFVAETFLGKSNLQVNHKDENKHNNNIKNLEFVTHKENMNYGTKQDRESKIKTKYHINQYDKNGKFIKQWFNLREIVLSTEYKKANIQYCCLGKIKYAYGYKWEYVPVL